MQHTFALDIKTGTLSLISSREALASLTFRRGGRNELRVFVTEHGSPVDLPAGYTLESSAKQSADSPNALIFSAWSGTSPATCTVQVAGSVLDGLLSTDGDPSNDVESVDLLFDVLVLNGSGEVVTQSQRITLTVENTVTHGGESGPELAPLSARLIESLPGVTVFMGTDESALDHKPTVSLPLGWRVAVEDAGKLYVMKLVDPEAHPAGLGTRIQPQDYNEETNRKMWEEFPTVDTWLLTQLQNSASEASTKAENALAATAALSTSKLDASATSYGGVVDKVPRGLAGGILADSWFRKALGDYGKLVTGNSVAGTLDLGTLSGFACNAIGSVPLSSLGSSGVAGALYVVHIQNARTIVHHATNLILPGGADIVATAGDVALFLATGASTWRCVGYQRANGKAVGLNNVPDYGVASQAEAEAGTAANKLMTPERTKQAITALGGGGGASIVTPNVGYATTAGNDTTGDGSITNPVRNAQKLYDLGFRVLHLGVGGFGSITLTGGGAQTLHISGEGAAQTTVTAVIGTGLGALTISDTPGQSVTISMITQSDGQALNLFGVYATDVSANGLQGSVEGITWGGSGGSITLRDDCRITGYLSAAGGSGASGTGANGADGGQLRIYGASQIDGNINLNGGDGGSGNSESIGGQGGSAGLLHIWGGARLFGSILEMLSGQGGADFGGGSGSPGGSGGVSLYAGPYLNKTPTTNGELAWDVKGAFIEGTFLTSM